jgi:hypothetical protein
LINVHAPTNEKTEEVKEEFYNLLKQNINQKANSYIEIMLRDFDLISNRFRCAVTDIRALRGPDIGTDHNLLKINFRVKLMVKTEKEYNETRKIVNIFQNSE